jgi:hypothetical protein
MKELIRFLAIITVCLMFAYNAAAQDEPKVCISRQAAETCATNAAKVAALEAHILTLEQALKDERKIVQDLRVEVARYSGRIESCEKNDASNRAIITAMIPLLRRKSIGLITF